MVEAKVAKENTEEAFFNIDGERVDADSHDRLGLATRFEVTHPEWIVFVDETGANTNLERMGCGKESRGNHKEGICQGLALLYSCISKRNR